MGEKTFTQEEVNAIVQERLAREKEKHDNQLQDMQKDVARREKALAVKEELAKRGLPDALCDLVKADDDEAIKNSLDLLETTYKQNRVAGQNINHKYVPAGGMATYTDPVREAMGLKR